MNMEKEMMVWKQGTKVRNCQTSSDLTHLGDGGLICGDAAELLVFWRGCSGQPQHQRKQTLVPAEGLFGQLTARQRRVQRQVQLDDRHGQERQGWCENKPVTNLIIQINTKSEQITLPHTVRGSTTAFVCVLTSSGTPELCVSLFPSVIVMITDGSRKNGLRPWERGNSNIQQLNPSSGKQWAWLFSLCFLFFMLYIKNIVLGSVCLKGISIC